MKEFGDEDRVSLINYCKDNGIMIQVRSPNHSFEYDPTHDHTNPNRGLNWVIDVGNIPRTINNQLAWDLRTSTRTHTPNEIRVTESLAIELNSRLQDEDDDVRKLSLLPIERSFLYVDVSDFSKEEPKNQALIINSLSGMIDELKNKPLGNEIPDNPLAKLEAKLCIGDGYILVFKSATRALSFAGHLAFLIEHRRAIAQLPIEFHFRMGVHVGPVFCFWDTGRNGWNYIGEAINGGNRVLSVIGKDLDDVVFFSSQVLDNVRARKFAFIPKHILQSVDNRGRRKDKHDKPWRVYQLNQDRFVGWVTTSTDWLTAPTE